MPGRQTLEEGGEQRVSDEELSWILEHADDAAGWVSADRFLRMALIVTFVVGLALNLLGYGIANGSVPALVLPADLAAELISNLGIIMWTSVVVVIFIEVVPERERRRAERYLIQARSALRDQGRALPDRLDAAVEAVADNGENGQLDLVLARLAAIERMLDERLPGRATNQ